MSNLVWPLLCWRKKTRVVVVHEKAGHQMWTDIDILGSCMIFAIMMTTLFKRKIVLEIWGCFLSKSSQLCYECWRIGHLLIRWMRLPGWGSPLFWRVRFCDAGENLYTKDYLRRPTPRDLQRLLQKAESRGFPGMIGSIDCMHWQWKNCPSAWQGDYGNQKGQKSIILEAVAGFDTWVWHAFFGVAGSQNDLNVLGQSPVFNDVLRGEGPTITYQINNTVYQNGYYLADGIYPRWTTFVKSIPHPRSHKEIFFAAYQEGYRKDVERYFGILQARWAIIRGAAHLFDEEVLRSIMMTCIILHNMIVEDEYDYDADEVYEPDPMNTALTRIYEKPMGPNGEPVQHDSLVRDGSLMHRMIERYTEMQSSYIHEHRQVDLMEHL
ncbi:unnamed protein product [Prunus brigantina]